MVSKRRLDCEFNGYRAPIIPRAPRSIRRRGHHKKLVEDSDLCAFELLAAVAGRLLQESDSSATSNVSEGKYQLGSCQDGNQKAQPRDGALKSEILDHGSYAESVVAPEISVQEHNLLSNFKSILQAANDCVIDHQTSVHASCNLVEKTDCDIELGIFENKDADEKSTCVVGGSVRTGDSFSCKVDTGLEVEADNGKNQTACLSLANTSTVNDPVGDHVNANILIDSKSSVKLPLYRNSIHGASLRKCWNNVKLGIRDDDENVFACYKSCTKRLLRPSHRLRKMMASKYWKASPKLKNYDFYNTSEAMNSSYRYRRSIDARERCQRTLLKKRKLSDHNFDFTFNQEWSSDSISNLPEKGMRGDKNSSDVISHRARGASTDGHSKENDPHVKFSIKSFKVPELYIEVPETATVGSLKRTVMDAVTAIIGGGIRVGVIFQGKKVRDEHRTLQQTGISRCRDLDNLGFMLEPSFAHCFPHVTPGKPPVLSSWDADQALPRCLASPVIGSVISNTSVDPPFVTKSDNVDKNGFVSSSMTPDNALMDVAVADSEALVPVPSMDAEAVVLTNSKPKCTEVSKRRTRRPFSIAEVEALVEAVENLGTGRWRDVKMRAFEIADHRTYVDLKDKWKTLVHTASISPQQRRGEPVPHELLVRVLSAHSYWSQHQSKQHGKQHPVEPLKAVNSHEEMVEA